MDFWTRLKDEVKTQNTTQEWVAQQVGVPFGTFRKWLSRRTMPNADQAVRLARVLGTTVEELVDGTPPQTLGARDRELLDQAKRYRSVLDDLDILDETNRVVLIGAIHGAADTARLSKNTSPSTAAS